MASNLPHLSLTSAATIRVLCLKDVAGPCIHWPLAKSQCVCFRVSSTTQLTGPDRDGLMGYTLTMGPRDGLFLNTFLALFISWVGLESWALMCFVFHQLRSSDEPQDTLHHQLQVLLRSGLRDFQFFWQALRVGTAWDRFPNSRPRMVRPFRRLTPLALTAAIHGIAFAAASIYSANVATTDGEVVLHSKVCGLPNGTTENYKLSDLPNMKSFDDLQSLSALWIYGRWAYDQALDYAEGCYSHSPTTFDSCNKFVRKNLDSSYRTDDPCPFGDLCIAPATSVQTPVLDTHSDFGFNAPPAHRVGFRKRSTCAPLDIARVSTDWARLTVPLGIPWKLPPYHNASALVKTYRLGAQHYTPEPTPFTYASITNVTTADVKRYETL